MFEGGWKNDRGSREKWKHMREKFQGGCIEMIRELRADQEEKQPDPGENFMWESRNAEKEKKTGKIYGTGPEIRAGKTGGRR